MRVAAGPVRRGVGATAMPLRAVPAMHEQMHQRASRQQQVGQGAEDVRRVPGDQEEGGDGEEAAEHEPEAGLPPGPLCSLARHVAPSVPQP